MKKTGKSLISVLLPIRPEASGLVASVQSIKNQSVNDWHIIALLDRDNGDNLATLNSLLSEEQFTAVSCNYQEVGFPAMLNLGLLHCEGSFVARQDDDDISTPNRFELQIDCLTGNEAVSLCCGFARVIDDSGNYLYSIKQPADNTLLSIELVKNNILPHSSVMFRKEAIQKLGGYRLDMHGCEDYDLWLRLLSVGQISSVNETILTYLSNPLGMTKTPISLSTIRKLRISRMNAQREIGLGPCKANINDYVWSMRQILNQYL